MKEKRFKTVDNRWGPGRVHRMVYSRENRVWYLGCKSPAAPLPHGGHTDLEVTCKRCKGEHTVTFDYSKYRNTGDFFKFEEVGDQITGIVKVVREGRTFNGEPCPELVLEVTDEEGNADEKTVTASQVRLKAALAESRPQVGDKIRITYSGVGEASPGKAPPKEFTVEVKAGPHEMVQPVPANSEAPF